MGMKLAMDMAYKGVWEWVCYTNTQMVLIGRWDKLDKEGAFHSI